MSSALSVGSTSTRTACVQVSMTTTQAMTLGPANIKQEMENERNQ